MFIFVNTLRSYLFYIGYFVSLIIIGLLSVPLLFFPLKIAAPIVLLWNRFVLFWLRICCGIKHKMFGNTENIPRPCVVIANHQGPWETIFLQLYFFPLTTVLKRELLWIPFFGWGMRLLNPIPIDRNSPIESLRKIRKIGVTRLTEGQNVLIFPEGTRQPVDHLGRFTRSGAEIAKVANVPIIVIAQDSGNYWTNKQVLKNPGIVHITVSKPISVTDKNTKELMDTIRLWIQSSLRW